MENDWRLDDSQSGKQFAGHSFEFRQYVPVEKGNDHDHCEFCGRTFFHTKLDDNTNTEGYVTEVIHKKGKKQGHWVCKECFTDFKEKLNLKEIAK